MHCAVIKTTGIFLLLLYLCWNFSSIKPIHYDDSTNYEFVAQSLKNGDYSVLKDNGRPPAYPLFLLLSEALHLSPNVLAVAVNTLVALLVLLITPNLTGTAVALSYLILHSSSCLLSYENTLLTESILPFFLFTAYLLGFLAIKQWMQKRYFFWAFLLFFQYLWLISLKPAFKVYFALELLLLFYFVFKNKIFSSFKEKKALLAVFAFFTAVISTSLFFQNSGSGALQNNKRIMITLTFLQEPSLDLLWEMPKELLPVYEDVQVCRKQNHLFSCTREVNIAEAEKLHDYLVFHHPWQFFKTQLNKMFNILYFSTWGEDYGRINKQVGIPRGFGIGGILMITSFLGFIFWFLFHKKEKVNILQLAGLATLTIYNFAIEMFLCPADLGRYSIPWIITLYPLLVLLWWKLYIFFYQWCFKV